MQFLVRTFFHREHYDLNIKPMTKIREHPVDFNQDFWPDQNILDITLLGASYTYVWDWSILYITMFGASYTYEQIEVF